MGERNLRNERYKKNIMNAGIRAWSNISKNISSAIGLEKIRIIDVGGSSGHFLLGMSKSGHLEKGVLVEPCFDDLMNEYLSAYQRDEEFFRRNGITVEKKFAEDPNLNLSGSDLIVKTYVPWVSLDILIDRSDSKYFLVNSNGCDGDCLDKLDLIHQFNSFYSKADERTYIEHFKNQSMYNLYQRK